MKKDLNLSTTEWVQKAYKKLKNYLYFDKTQLPLVDSLVAFESGNIDLGLAEIARALDTGGDVWEDFTDDILEKIDVFVYPKRLCSYAGKQIIFNADSEPVRMEAAKYFIDLAVAGHILGTLWVMIIGACLDQQDDPEQPLMYEHSYGNRLRKNLYDPERGTVTCSPYLFEPYFSQYENWRDTALAHAKERLDNDQDALILTLDFRNFFYSADLSKEDFSDIYQIFQASVDDCPVWAERLNSFVYQVLQKYSQTLCFINTDQELSLDWRTFLPIGFLPSYILSNWILTRFDTAVTERINPVYYGRYVDDIIIVDKVEKNSPLYRKARGASEDQKKLTAGEIIEYYFGPSSQQEEGRTGLKTRIFRKVDHPPSSEAQGLDQCPAADPREQPAVVYRVDPDVLGTHGGSDIQVQNDKVKVFYFREGSTRALLDCFRAEIGHNASEFRYLPDVDRILSDNDYSEIFKLSNNETPHKLRGVSNVTLDKFSLSKFLGKYRKVGNLIRDKRENAFDRDLLTILNRRALIDNYTLWERLLEILVVNDRLDYYGKLVKSILDAIAAYEVPDNLVDTQNCVCRRGLYLTLQTAVCRTSALCWGAKMDKILAGIEAAVKDLPTGFSLFQQYDLKEQRINYCLCRMVNKYVLPLPIGWLKREVFEESGKTVNLCRLESFCAYLDWDTTEEPYAYFPYMVTPQEIAYAFACKSIAQGEPMDDPSEQIERIRKIYALWNYCRPDDSDENISLASIDAQFIKTGTAKGCCAIRVDSPASSKIKVAVGNARLYADDFKKRLTGRPNLSHDRYRQIRKLVEEALTEKADLLVLPENFLPWEWLPDILRMCANNQMALITGIEHIVSIQTEGKPRRVYNLTAVILPYRENDHKFAHVVYHHKVHYSPNEARMIRGYRMEPFLGSDYQLFHWKDLWFSVYCCFELASIADRSLFQGLADLTVAVEWNRDVPYFSSIVESLCRDLHCYCIQVNSSDYGDSRVMIPAKTEERDLIKTKGGRNHTILVDDIDLDPLRDYQCKEFELQRDDHRFKPTPPRFDPYIPELKQGGALWEYLTGD